MNKFKARPLSIQFRLYRFICLIIFFFLVRKIRGLENLPKDKAFILASNHAALFDGLLLTTYLSKPIKRHLHYISKAKYYKNPLFRLLMETAENIKMEERQESKALLIAIDYLRRGENVAIFPEGTRSHDGKIQKGKTGVASLALSAKVPVVPIGLIDTHKVLPWGEVMPRAAKCEINVGKPMEFQDYYKDYDEAVVQDDQAKIIEIEENVVRIIMQEIARLSNQEYLY